MNTKPNCAWHPKDVNGETDMLRLAEMIGNLHYKTLGELLYCLNAKLHNDGARDAAAGRTDLAFALFKAADHMMEARSAIGMAWNTSRPFMRADKYVQLEFPNFKDLHH